VKRAIIAIAFIYLAHFCPLAAPRVSQISQAETPITVPFSGANNLVVINATLNGKGPFRFALDTGSSAHVLNREIAGRLGLRILGPATADSGYKTTSAEVTEVSEISVGELTLRNQRIFVMPFPASYPFDGFLGADLFKQFVVTIDFARSVVTLGSPLQFSAPVPGELVPLKMRDGLIPEIKAEVDGHTGWFKVDTAYNGYLALFAEFVAKHRKFANKSSYPSTKAAGGETVTGAVGDTSLIQIGLLRIKTVSRVPRGRDGEILVSKLPAALFPAKGGSNSAYAGAIGTMVLHQFKVTFNYSQRVMVLSPAR
jgi:Aspartyl protease